MQSAVSDSACEELTTPDRRMSVHIVFVCIWGAVLAAFYGVGMCTHTPWVSLDRDVSGWKVPANCESAGVWASLPGIGPRLGEAISRDVRESGLFRDAEDLQRVHGIGPYRATQLEPFIAFP